MSAYFAELAERLRAGGVPPERITATIADLTSYAGDSGADPEEEFGPAAELAGQLTGTDGAGEPRTQTWRWTANVDERLLNGFGDQGWEIERVEPFGRFAARRDTARPQRWEYRTEVVGPGELRPLEARLAPDGWEPCGRWLCYALFKRPSAASLGPAAELGAPPEQPAGSVFLTRRFLLAAAVAAAAAAVAGVISTVASGDPMEGAGFASGLAAGALVCGALLALLGALGNRR